MTSQRRIGVLLGYANILTKNLVNLIYTPMLLSFVGQADYGVYQSCYSFVFSLTLLSFGFSQAYVRFYTQRKIHGTDADINKLNGVYLILFLVVSVAAFAFGLAFAAGAETVFSNGFTPEQVEVARIVISVLSGNIALTLFNSVFDAFVMAHEEFRFQQSRQLATTAVTPFVAYVLLECGMGVIGVAVAQLMVSASLLILDMSFCVRRLNMRFDVCGFDFKLLKAIAGFSAWIFSNQVCELVNQNVPNVLLGAFSGAVAVSVFAVSVQIRSVFYSLSTTMSNVFIPLVNRIVADTDDNIELTLLMTRIGRYQAILYMWVLGGFALLGRFFIVEWAGEGFKDAYLLILAMVTPLFIPLVQNTGIEIQRARNMHRARSVCYLVVALLNLAFTVILAPSIGYWAPTMGYISYVVIGCGFFMNWYYQARVGLDMAHFWRRILPVVAVGAIAAGLCALASVVLPVDGWFPFFIWGFIYTFIYTALIIAIVFDSDERAKVVKWVRHFGATK